MTNQTFTKHSTIKPISGSWLSIYWHDKRIPLAEAARYYNEYGTWLKENHPDMIKSIK